MAFQFKKRFLPYATLATVAVSSAVIFQNCSQVAFTPAVDGVLNAASTNPNYADGTMGETTNLPDLKLFFVIDNSHTMSSSNIKLSQSFADLFSGTNSNSLGLFNTEVSVISTAQNLNRNPSQINRNMQLVNWLLSNNLAAINTTPKFQLNQSDRGPLLTGHIPGDLIGIEAVKKANPYGADDDIFIQAAPVLGFSDGPNGTALFSSSIKKPVSGSVDALNAEFKARLDLLNPSRNQVVDSDLLGEPMSQESGLCALARIMKHSDTMMKPSDIVSFVVVSDEDDAFSSGAECLEAFTKVADPKSYISGTCDYRETKLSYTKKVTNFSYTYKTPDTPATERVPAQCTIDSANQIQFAYNIKKYVTTATPQYTTLVNYYKATSITQDNIVKWTYTAQAPKTVPVNLDGKCDAANLKAYLPTDTEYTVAAYKPVCGAAVRGDDKISNNLTVVASSQSTPIMFFNDADLVSAGLTVDILGNSCNSTSDCYKTKVPSVIRAKDSRLSDSALLITDVAIKTYSSGSSKLVIFGDYNKKDISLTQCQAALKTCTSQGLLCGQNYVKETAAQPAVVGQSIDVAQTLDGTVSSCDSSCAGTSFCANTPTKTIKDYLQGAEKRGTITSCSSFVPAVSGSVAVNTFFGGFSCDSQCKDTTFCPTEGTKFVKDSLQALLASQGKVMASCSQVVQDQSVSFKDQPASYQCAKGDIKVNGVDASHVVDHTEYVSGTKPEGGVAKDLISFVTDKSNSYFSQNKPFFNFFVMQPADQAAGRLADQQTVGTSYNKLSAAVGGRSNSILLSSYSSALKDLSEVIKTRVGKSIYFPQVGNWQTIHTVWVNGVEAKPGQDWNASGSMVTFTDSFNIQRLDHVKIEFN